MWPGQQPPGGEQNPQDQNPNPYQQPGYQQPNPYQQPGYQQQPGYPQQGYQQQGQAGQQPNPYQQPTVPQQYAVPGPPGPAPGKKRTTVVAVVAAAVVVIAAAGTTFFVMNTDDDESGKNNKAGEDAKPSVSKEPTSSAPVDNPRDGSSVSKPLIAGWKVVTNPKHGTQFDVPADWEVSGTGVHSGFEDEKKGDGSPVITFSAPAFYKSTWCSQDTNKDGKMEDSSLAGTGTKGGEGAENTASAARSEAGTWVWAAYDQEETPEVAAKGKVKMSKAEAYTTKSGLKGHFATATATGVAKEDKCDTDGKSIAFTFTNAKGDFATWVLYTSKGVPYELPDETIKKIMSTVRLAKAS
ncbi:hypothetical protein ACIOJD_12920 [Streptomyces sp. NPDC088116]|uniref:hypothetical protein n=1 Tax=Streptomyces sp. NPDC088116 TaxID=3365825 RepID=UPI003829889B